MKWHATDGLVRLEDQIQQLQGDIGTAREWTSIVIDDEDGEAEVVALCHETHAPLISSAPDLLEALEDLMKMRSACFIPNAGDWWDRKAEAAIAKAKGSTP